VDQIDEEEEENLPSNGVIQSTRKKKTPKEHVNIPSKFFSHYINIIYF
jgi:hypothetical protein